MTNRAAWDEWRTIAFTPTTTAVNHFEDGNTHPCPGFLLQERRGTTYRREDGTYTTVTHKPPLDTRVVAGDLDFGLVEPADELDNYTGTSIKGDTE